MRMLVMLRPTALRVASLAQRQGAATSAPFSSKRRARFGGDEGERKRQDKLFSALRVKQQEQLRRLRESLVREEREAAAKQQRDASTGEAQAAPTAAAATTATTTTTTNGDGAASSDPDEAAAARRSRRQMRDFERMIARKAVRQERVKHLPLFREDSPLWRLHGGSARTLLHYDALPSLSFDGAVDVVHSADEERPFAAYLSQQRVVGIDTESMPTFDTKKSHNPVCLIQIATLERSFLYRIPRGGALPPMLRSLLEDPAVVKVGHSLDDDFRLLKKSQLVSAVATTIDTLPVGTKLGCLRPGLKTLCKLFLGGKISKEMQVSNWEAPELSADQIRYAATDAWAPLKVMLEMIQLDEARTVLLVKSYNDRGKVVSRDLDSVLATLEECYLDHRAQTLEHEEGVI